MLTFNGGTLRRAVKSLRAAALAAGLMPVALAWATPAAADEWLPHPAGAQWQYAWSDSSYNPAGTIENVIVQSQTGTTFTLAWADTADTPPAAGTNPSCFSATADIGTISFQDTNAGLINTNWNSCPPPADAPILCAVVSPCPNSLSSAFYNVIWGNRVPVLSEPLLQGLSWNATGGAQNDVGSTSFYLGLQSVKVPAFPGGVTAAVVRTNIVQVGALGDPYGSGTRTTWWVDGVGPVKVVFAHTGGGLASYGPPPVTAVSLLSTSLKPVKPPPDQDYFPLVVGTKGTYKWTNKKHLPQPEVEAVSVAAASNRSARIQVKSVSGPIRALGQYLFSTRLDGVTNLSGSVSAATLVKFPALGHRRHFFTPLDLMTYGFHPMLPAYPVPGTVWHSGDASDFHIYGVTGTNTVLGVRRVRVPAGTFNALEVRSVLSQRGHRFGSGVRTMWFGAGRGLVKLVFKHGDGSTSVVQLLKK
jgi:hypothetical protein